MECGGLSHPPAGVEADWRARNGGPQGPAYAPIALLFDQSGDGVIAHANERIALNRAGQVVLTLKTPYRDGTTHLVMSPLEFMQRLAALVSRPRLRLIRFHGVLAPKHMSRTFETRRNIYPDTGGGIKPPAI